MSQNNYWKAMIYIFEKEKGHDEEMLEIIMQESSLLIYNDNFCISQMDGEVCLVYRAEAGRIVSAKEVPLIFFKEN